MGKIKEPPKEKRVKYSDIEKIFHQIDTYLDKIRESSKNTETEAEKRAYEQEFENLKNEIRRLGNYQAEMKISKFADTEFMENFAQIKLKTITKSKTQDPKPTYKKIKKSLNKLERKIKPKTSKEILVDIFWWVLRIVMIYAALRFIGFILLVMFILFLAG